MLRTLLVDDEPLVLVGLKSLVDWQKLGFEVIGTASNGQLAYNIIESVKPDVIITDIKMPVMDGLELMERCISQLSYKPVFVFLTSYDEFVLARMALRLGAWDYVLKLELTQERITNILESIAARYAKSHSKKLNQTYQDSTKLYRDMIGGYYVHEWEIEDEAVQQDIALLGKPYVIGVLNLMDDQTSTGPSGSLPKTMQYVKDMFFEVMAKVYDIRLIPLNRTSMVLILHQKHEDEGENMEEVSAIIGDTLTTICKYFRVELVCGLGEFHSMYTEMDEAYHEALEALEYVEHGSRVGYKSKQKDLPHNKRSFNIKFLQRDLTKAIEHRDLGDVRKILDELIDLLTHHHASAVQGVDLCSRLIFLLLGLLDQGEQLLEQIFDKDPDGYRSIYASQQLVDVTAWLMKLRDGFQIILPLEGDEQDHYVVKKVVRYIRHHYDEKFTLNELAHRYGLTPNYLSAVFKKQMGIGFNEYVANTRVNVAKQLLLESDKKINEVAGCLGFDNAYYFSKVFKRVTGQSPRNYMIEQKIQ